MAMNLARTGIAGVVGVASGALFPETVAGGPGIKPIDIGGTKIGWDTVAEGVALVGGAAMQLLAPFTMPSIADGLVDGGLALLARRGTTLALKQVQASPYANPYAMPNLAHRATAARGAVGGVSDLPNKVRLT